MSGSKITFCCVGICFLAVWLYRRYHATRCWEDVLENKRHCTPSCSNGSFVLAGMTECRKWLTCSDDVVTNNVIVRSVVKTVYLAEWNGFSIVKSELASLEYEKDFSENLRMLILFAESFHTVQFLGFCNYSIYTQYYKLGSALNLHHHLSRMPSTYDTLATRFQFCIHYVAILAFLHSYINGVRVMCDSSTLEKTLSQYLLTDDLKLVLNDMDALPSTKHNGVICGTRQLNGTFVAPEQLWSSSNEPFSYEKMDPYDEKSDVWKIPDVCLWFLGDDNQLDVIKFKLFKIHKMCKNKNPNARPLSQMVLQAYKKIWSKL